MDDAKTGKTIVPVAKALIVYGTRALLMHRCETCAVGPGSWEFAGGKLEFGETPEEALTREVREETGLRLVPEKLLYAASWRPLPDRQYVVLYYLCHAPREEITLSEEHIGYKWVGRAELRRLLPENMWAPLAQSGILETLGLDA